MNYTLLTTTGMQYGLTMENFNPKQWAETLSSAAHTHLSIAGMVLSKAAILAIYPTELDQEIAQPPNLELQLNNGMKLALQVPDFDSTATAAAINAGGFIQLGEAILSGRYITSAAPA